MKRSEAILSPGCFSPNALAIASTRAHAPLFLTTCALRWSDGAHINMRSSDPPGRLTEPEAGRARKDRPMLRTFLSERGECPFDTVVSVCATAGIRADAMKLRIATESLIIIIIIIIIITITHQSPHTYNHTTRLKDNILNIS